MFSFDQAGPGDRRQKASRRLRGQLMSGKGFCYSFMARKRVLSLVFDGRVIARVYSSMIFPTTGGSRLRASFSHEG
eukprot:scaffold25041_cov66-Cyclotella_meneghiniana.AAC.5